MSDQIQSTESVQKSEWRKTATPGLYQRANGSFYSRYSINGKRTWRSQETEVYTVAKLRHEKARFGIEQTRQSGLQISSDLRTMGAITRGLFAEVDKMDIGAPAKKTYHLWVKRLQSVWPTDYETSLARNITREVVLEIRERLQKYVQKHRKTDHAGYKPHCINQTLYALKLMLDIAKMNHVITVSPFDNVGTMTRSLFLAKANRRPEIPSNADIERVFAQIERFDEYSDVDDGTLHYIRECRANAAEHARFLAYSGMRLAEAQASLIEDDHGDTLLVRGTKTKTSWRTIPIIPPLRALLDRIKTKRISGPTLATARSIRMMRTACKKLGMTPITHHDLRHYFCTVCIESGVPIPTVADWLGHADGGITLMKTYRHLRNQHSLDAAKLVTLQPQPVLSISA